MKLVVLGSPNSPYLRKVRVFAIEKGIELGFQPNSPWTRETLATTYNPLGKIPILIREDGSTLYDSRVIVEFLDICAPEPRLIPAADGPRIAVRRWEALADGVCDAVAAYFMERQYPTGQQRSDWIERQTRKIVHGLAALDEGLAAREWCVGDSLSLADAAVICALDYVSFRASEVIDWRAVHPALARWADRVGARESARRTAPPKPGETVFEGQTFRPGVV